MSARPRVFVTRRWPETVEDRLKALFDVTLNATDSPLEAKALREALEQHEALLPTVTDQLPAEVFADLQPKARIIANYGVGYSHIDTVAAAGLGIAVTNTPDVLTDCTADLAMLLMLMAARRAGEGERELRAGLWTGWRPTHLIGTKVTGATLGIVGFGRIGQAVAMRAHRGFGMTVLVFNRSAVAPEVLAHSAARQVATLDDLLAQSDFVSLHMPGGAANRHVIDAARLARMRPGAILVNTARGEVVDEQALAEALATGRIGGAGLDVYDGEPRIRSALLAAPNLVMLPHLGSATQATRDAMGMRVIDNLTAFFDGRPPPDRVA